MFIHYTHIVLIEHVHVYVHGKHWEVSESERL